MDNLLNKSKVVLIDSGCIGARAVFTMGNLSYSEAPTGVIFGFLKEIQRIATEFKTNDLMFFWDSEFSKRKEIFPEYKEKRKDTRTEKEKEIWAIAFEQYTELFENILPSLGWTNQHKVYGLEADDLLHQAAMQLHEKHDVIMVTSDKDMYQSLNYCSIYNPATKVEIDRLDLLNKYGITPKEWATMKILAGCTSDEVPGIPGIGEKTAIKFILGELKRHLKSYNSIVCGTWKSTLERNSKLVVLPFEGTPELEFWENEFNFDNFVSLCEKLGMVSLLGHYSITEWERILNASEFNSY
jgi:DNA polymerase-1